MDIRAVSEDRPTSSYKDNNAKFCGTSKFKKNSSNDASSNSPLLLRSNKLWNKSASQQKQFNAIAARDKSPFLYDRRVNKSFEATMEDYNNEKSGKNSLLRRSSTPQLNHRDSVSSSWCCGNFVMKQWKKMNQQY